MHRLMSHMRLAAMRMQCRVLLIVGLISSCLLMGCTSNFHFERFYKPAATLEGAPAVLPPRATPPQLAYSQDPDRDGRLLRQNGYALIGTTSFFGAADLPFAEHAAAQGQKVGAGIVLLESRSYALGGDQVLGNPEAHGADYFASYWAKSEPESTSKAN
jgi:hypothetical protein